AEAFVPVKSFRAALLQPSIYLYAKWDAAEAWNIKANIENLLSGIKGADLVVWPENALPCWIDEPDCGVWLKAAVSSGAAPGSFVGSVSKGGVRHVSAFLLDGKGEITASYNKRQLVPFGEYVPFRAFLGRYIQPVAALGEFEPGDAEQKPLDFKGGRLGAAICYESVFPYLFSGDTQAGADVFVNITNDGWYLDTAAPYQHFIANIFRAVENRRTVLRAANNGISGLIDPWGRVQAKTALNQRAVLEVNASVYGAEALFPLYGHWFALAALLIASAFLLFI
ncbi:MAG: apolipoprotein N-acyltransferase, partial [Deltaproteobacteria bacterium]